MKQIVFHIEEIRALIEDRKTVFRRVVKPQPEFRNGETGTPTLMDDGTWSFKLNQYSDIYDYPVKPLYQAGDILYVREAWAMYSNILGGEAGPVYMADYTDLELKELKKKHFRWHSSSQMPKEVARIFLRVTDVRLERLRDMHLIDCMREGVRLSPIEEGDLVIQGIRARERFAGVWDSVVKSAGPGRPTYGWDANPWMWVIQFERICKEKALDGGETA